MSSAARLLVLALLVSVPAPVAGAMSPAPQEPQDQVPSMEAAEALFEAQEWRRAADAYQRIVQAQPGNGLAWFRLGYALHLDGQLERAHDVHVETTAFPQYRTVAMYNHACSHALLGETDATIVSLREALAAGFSNLELLRTDSDLDSVRDDPRFQAILAELDPKVDAPAGPQGPGGGAATAALDFLLGTWEKSRDGVAQGVQTVTRALGGRGFRETVSGSDPAEPPASSFYVFSASEGLWRQIWVNAAGDYAVLVGGREGERLVLRQVSLNGEPRGGVRMVYGEITPERYTCDYEVSADGGETWQRKSRFVFTRR